MPLPQQTSRQTIGSTSLVWRYASAWYIAACLLVGGVYGGTAAGATPDDPVSAHQSALRADDVRAAVLSRILRDWAPNEISPPIATTYRKVPMYLPIVYDPDAPAGQRGRRGHIVYWNEPVRWIEAYFVYIWEDTTDDGADAWHDPSPTFLRRFAAHRVPVLPGSVMIDGKKTLINSPVPGDFSIMRPSPHFVDRTTGRGGVSVSLGPVVWLGRDRVKITVGYATSPMSGISYHLVLVLRDGHWRLVKKTAGLVT